MTTSRSDAYADTETTFTDLYARIDKTIAFINGIKREQLRDAAERQITLTLPSGSMNFTGKDFLLNFATPNLYFHVTTTYALLRHSGVELGKMDFLGAR